MTGVEIAGMLKDYGLAGYGALVTLALVKVYRDKEALSTGFLERLVKGLEAATDAAEGTKAALNELRALIDTSGKSVGDHSHQIAILVEKIIHGFGNTSAALDGVARRLESMNGRDSQGRS